MCRRRNDVGPQRAQKLPNRAKRRGASPLKASVATSQMRATAHRLSHSVPQGPGRQIGTAERMATESRVARTVRRGDRLSSRGRTSGSFATSGRHQSLCGSASLGRSRLAAPRTKRTRLSAAAARRVASAGSRVNLAALRRRPGSRAGSGRLGRDGRQSCSTKSLVSKPRPCFKS